MQIITTNSEYVLATEFMLKFRSGVAQLWGVPLGCKSFSLLQLLDGGWGGLAPPGVRATAAYKDKDYQELWRKNGTRTGLNLEMIPDWYH